MISDDDGDDNYADRSSDRGGDPPLQCNRIPIHNKTNTNILRQIFLIQIDTVCASWKDIEREREREREERSCVL